MSNNLQIGQTKWLFLHAPKKAVPSKIIGIGHGIKGTVALVRTPNDGKICTSADLLFDTELECLRFEVFGVSDWKTLKKSERRAV